MLSEHCTTCMACRHVMSSERISYTVTQTVHLLGTQAFVITVAQPFCHTSWGASHGGPSLRRCSSPSTTSLCAPQTCLVGRVNAVVPDPHLGCHPLPRSGLAGTNVPVASLHGRALPIRCRRLKFAFRVRTKPLCQAFDSGIALVAPHRSECDVRRVVCHDNASVAAA